MLAKQPQLRITALDSTESSAVMLFHVPRGAGAASVMAASNGMRGLLGGVSGCAFVEQHVTYSSVETAPRDALASSSTSDIALFIFSCGPGQYLSLQLPGIRPHMLIPDMCGGQAIDMTHPAILAFVEEIISGAWCNPFGAGALQLEAAMLQKGK